MVGKGSCFKMCVEFPNSLDRRRTRQAGFEDKAGGEWTHAEAFGVDKPLAFWKILEQGYNAFNAEPNPLRVRQGKSRNEFR
ncbi:MAG: hypothetical protein HY927_14205 [Elusimicrobia bacterium]|nr:hypothetical protein [Elusimicrobiota bacterium]